MAISWVIPVRVVQAVLALIVLALTAYVVNWFDEHTPWFTLDVVNFMLFNGVWTLFIAIPYFALVPVFFPRLAPQPAVLGAEALTMIFWFAGFIALAAWLPPSSQCRTSPCRSLQAATVFGSFEWALFAVTAGVLIANVVRSRSYSIDRTKPQQPAQGA